MNAFTLLVTKLGHAKFELLFVLFTHALSYIITPRAAMRHTSSVKRSNGTPIYYEHNLRF